MALALSFFEIDLKVKDVAYDTVNGEDRKNLVGERTLKAAVDPTGGRRLENIFGGSVSDGDIGIFTTGKLHVGDIYDFVTVPAVAFGGEAVTFGGEPVSWQGEETTSVSLSIEGDGSVTFDGQPVTMGGEEVTFGAPPQLQSFATYRGFQYRITEVSDWTEQAGVRVYLGKRHVDQN
jgi:uncharacterized Zn-binding protein involved in type VI secretion